MLGVVLLAAGSSPLPLISLLQHEHGNRVPVHPQQYAGDDARASRRRLSRRQMAEDATLTSDNTVPMRIHLDFRSLYEEHAPKYTACFGFCEPGASVCDHWFKRGLPASEEPDGVETCARDGTPEQLALNVREGCWGKCRAADVITAADRAKVEDVVTVRAPLALVECSPLCSHLSCLPLCWGAAIGDLNRRCWPVSFRIILPSSPPRI